MANKRDKLEKRAKELNLTFVPETTDDELEQLISDFEDNGTPQQDPEGADGLGTFGDDYKFYKSSLVPGLSVQIGDEPERDEIPQRVRFTPYSFFIEEKGETVQVGYLATDESDAIEVLADDPNVEEIDENEYREALKTGTRAKL